MFTRLKLSYDEPLSNYAFNFNLRRYIELEKSGEYPYRITYDAKDPLGNTAVTAIREIYVENPCAAVFSAGFICLELSEKGMPVVCATCTVDGCLCIDPGATVAAVVAQIIVFVVGLWPGRYKGLGRILLAISIIQRMPFVCLLTKQGYDM